MFGQCKHTCMFETLNHLKQHPVKIVVNRNVNLSILSHL